MDNKKMTNRLADTKHPANPAYLGDDVVETPMEVEHTGNSQFTATGSSPMNQAIPMQSDFATTQLVEQEHNDIAETPLERDDSGNSQFTATGSSPMNQAIPPINQPLTKNELGHSADNMDGAELIDINEANKRK